MTDPMTDERLENIRAAMLNGDQHDSYSLAIAGIMLLAEVDRLRARERSEWVSVDERLPDTPRAVLVGPCVEFTHSDEPFQEAMLPTPFGIDHWGDAEGGWWYGFKGVTHWHEMPPPPESTERQVQRGEGDNAPEQNPRTNPDPAG